MNIDLRLLAIVSDLIRTRSVSRTASNLELTQSSVSMALAKLRRHFNDPLFVRTSTGMDPTPHGSALIPLLQQAEGLLQTALDHHVVFDPRSSERCFNIYSTDIAQITMMPRLMKWLQEMAPSVRVELHRISDDTPKLLETGQADLMVGFVGPLGAGFCQQRLFKEKFVCAVRRSHSIIGDSFTLEQYQAETHLAVATCGTRHTMLEQAFEAKSVRRKIGLVVSSFLGIAPIITTLGYVATLPEQLALDLAQDGSIRVLPLPLNVPPYFIAQYWHERYTHDPASRWIRSVIAKLFARPEGDRTWRADHLDSAPGRRVALQVAKASHNSSLAGGLTKVTALKKHKRPERRAT